VLEQLLEWLKHGRGNMMAIFDATNTTRCASSFPADAVPNLLLTQRLCYAAIFHAANTIEVLPHTTEAVSVVN
jgi:hypothetical protein